jgi:hypothetical protein
MIRGSVPWQADLRLRKKSRSEFHYGKRDTRCLRCGTLYLRKHVKHSVCLWCLHEKEEVKSHVQ